MSPGDGVEGPFFDTANERGPLAYSYVAKWSLDSVPRAHFGWIMLRYWVGVIPFSFLKSLVK